MFVIVIGIFSRGLPIPCENCRFCQRMCTLHRVNRRSVGSAAHCCVQFALLSLSFTCNYRKASKSLTPSAMGFLQWERSTTSFSQGLLLMLRVFRLGSSIFLKRFLCPPVDVPLSLSAENSTCLGASSWEFLTTWPLHRGVVAWYHCLHAGGVRLSRNVDDSTPVVRLYQQTLCQIALVIFV